MYYRVGITQPMYMVTIVRGMVTFPAGAIPADGCYLVWQRDDVEGAPIGDFDVIGGGQATIVMVRDVMTPEAVALHTGVAMEEICGCEEETPLALEELERHVAYLEGARSILEMVMRGEACPSCGTHHPWEATALLVSLELVKMLVEEERQAFLALELIIEDPADTMGAGFTSTRQAQNLLERLRALMKWAET